MSPGALAIRVPPGNFPVMTSVESKDLPAPGPLNDALRDYLRQFEDAKERAVQLFAGLSPAQAQWQPAPESWSMADCLQHLNITAEQYYPAMDGAIKGGRERGVKGTPPFRHGFFVNWFVRMLEPPPRRRLKAPTKFRVGLGSADETEFPKFMAHQDALARRVQQSGGLHLARVKLVSPVSPLLRMSLGQCFALLAAHERRHLWQAAAVRRNPRFPPST